MPISDCEVRDPRIRRTRQLLQGALRVLLQGRNFEEISVQDIAEAATVNRATFYDHYNDKFALLEALVASGFHELLHSRQISYDGSCPSAAQAIIAASCDYLVLVHDGHAECVGQSSFGALMDAAMTMAIRKVLLRGGAELQSQSALSLGMTATIASHAIYGAAKEWYESTNRLSVEEIVPQILKVVLPMLPVRQARAVVAG